MATNYPDGPLSRSRASLESIGSETYELIPKLNPENFRRCRLRLPASLILHCSCVETERRHSELLIIKELPETVRDLKQLISEKFNIPIICQLQLSVNEMVLFDSQSLSLDVSLREGDQLKLEYFGQCSQDKLGHLVRQGQSISRFCSQYFTNRPNSNNDLILAPNNSSTNNNHKKHKYFRKPSLAKLFKKMKLKEFKKKSSSNSVSSERSVSPDQNRRTSSPHYSLEDMKRDANAVKWCLNYMYSHILLPWRDEGTLCQRLYLIQEELVDKIIDVWQWALETDDYGTQRACMLTLWDFGENWADRMYMFNRDVHTLALDVFMDPETDEETKSAALGLIAGFGEFPQGQKVIGINTNFLEAIATMFCQTGSSFMTTVIGGLLLSLASCHFVPQYMLDLHILETMKSDIDDINFRSVDELDLTYTLVLFFMYLLKSPDFKIPQGYSVQMFVQYFNDFSLFNTDSSIATSELEKETSWASMVPFLDLFFISNHSPIMRESINNPQLTTAYLKCAKLLLSAMLLQDLNRKLFLGEDLYGYLIFLSWHYKNNQLIGSHMQELLNRFKPAPFKTPTLATLAAAQYAFLVKGLGHVIDCNGIDEPH